MLAPADRIAVNEVLAMSEAYPHALGLKWGDIFLLLPDKLFNPDGSVPVAINKRAAALTHVLYRGSNGVVFQHDDTLTTAEIAITPHVTLVGEAEKIDLKGGLGTLSQSAVDLVMNGARGSDGNMIDVGWLLEQWSRLDSLSKSVSELQNSSDDVLARIDVWALRACQGFGSVVALVEMLQEYFLGKSWDAVAQLMNASATQSADIVGGWSRKGRTDKPKPLGMANPIRSTPNFTEINAVKSQLEAMGKQIGAAREEVLKSVNACIATALTARIAQEKKKLAPAFYAQFDSALELLKPGAKRPFFQYPRVTASRSGGGIRLEVNAIHIVTAAKCGGFQSNLIIDPSVEDYPLFAGAKSPMFTMTPFGGLSSYNRKRLIKPLQALAERVQTNEYEPKARIAPAKSLTSEEIAALMQPDYWEKQAKKSKE